MIITFTSDFGQRDGYAAIVKGVILSVTPQATVIDITHEIEAWNVAQAAWVLANAYPFFPHATVNLAVVDPLVGTAQRGVVIDAFSRYFVGPDNGLFSFVLSRCRSARAFAITNKTWFRETVSSTFHSRDVYGPVAAHLAFGKDPQLVGEELPLSGLCTLPKTEPRKTSKSIEGEVVYIDKFGNLITNIPNSLIVSNATCRVGGRDVGSVMNTYAQSQIGQPVALPGSHGHLEVGVFQGHAAQLLCAPIGTNVSLVL